MIHTVSNKVSYGFLIHRQFLFVLSHFTFLFLSVEESSKQLLFYTFLLFFKDKSIMCTPSKTSWCTVRSSRTCISCYKRYHITVDFPWFARDEVHRILASLHWRRQYVRSEQDSTCRRPLVLGCALHIYVPYILCFLLFHLYLCFHT